MSLEQYLRELEPDEVLDVYRHWIPGDRRPPSDEARLFAELSTRMRDREQIERLFEELPEKAQQLLAAIVERKGFRLSFEEVEREEGELPLPSYEIDATAFALRKRGFLFVLKDRDWLHFGQSVYAVPAELGRILRTIVGADETRSSVEQLSLRAWIQGLAREELEPRLERIGLDRALAQDRPALISQLCQPGCIEGVVAAIEDGALRDLVQRLLRSHGGIGERRHMERLGLLNDIHAGWGPELEELLLGTVLSIDLTDTGIALGPGSVVVFPEIVGGLLEHRLGRDIEDEPDAPADVMAELGQLRTFIDHHTVRLTREGSPYRATARKLITEVLSPGARTCTEEEALDWHLSFVKAMDFTRADAQGRLRTTEAWQAFESADPVAKTEELASFVRSDLEDVKGAVHMTRLRRLLLSILESRGRGVWTEIRAASLLARNRYLTGLDADAAAERFQRRFKYASMPELTPPAMLARELTRFVVGPLAWSGMVEIAVEDEDPVAVRLTRLGALVLGVEGETEARTEARPGALIVTADFEVVVFPEIGGITLVQEIGRFARRRKADYSLHFSIEQDSIHQAIARGLSAESILELLGREGRHPVPSNVAAQIEAWAQEVKVLAVRRCHLIKAVDAADLDALLRVSEIKAAAGERLNATTLELTEDPSTPRIAAALRGHRFFLQ